MYYRVPNILLFIVAPIMGGVFVMTFPLIILGFTLGVLCTVSYQGIVKLLQPTWEPNAAYFWKRKKLIDIPIHQNQTTREP